MKIVRLTIKNFLGIKEADIAPGKITVLAGKNGQGKTSVLKAIEALFKGAPLSVVHQGTERAELVADMEDIKVTRIFTHKATSVAVKNKDGFTRTAPQGFLDGLLGNFAFNPLAFLLADPKARRGILLKAMDVTATKEAIEKDAGEPVPLPESGPALEMYAETHKFFYSRRTEVNRRMKAKQAAAGEVLKKLPEGYKPPEDTEARAKETRDLIGAAESKMAVLEEQKKAAERAAKTRDRIRGEQKEVAARIDARAPIIEGITFTDADAKNAIDMVADLEAKLEVARKNRDHVTGERQRRMKLQEADEIDAGLIKKNADALEALPGAFNDGILAEASTLLVTLLAQAEAIAEDQARQRIWNEAEVLVAEAVAAAGQAEKLTALVERFGEELPAKALHEAKLPIDGLAIDGDQVTVGKIPIDQLSTEEQIRITLSIARALAKELPLICVDGVERLDEDHFAEFTKQAGSDGFQYFVTRVGEPREGEIGVAAGKVAVG